MSSLFNEFEDVSAKQWKQKIQFDLNGADYNKTLIWESNEGISVKPFYTHDDLKNLPTSTNTQATQWLIGQPIFVANTQKSNQKALKLTKQGVESIVFIIPTQDVSLVELLDNLEGLTIYLQFLFIPDVNSLFISTSNTKNKLHFQIDIIGNLAKTGNWLNNFNDDFSNLKPIFKHTKSLHINTALYQNAGANIVQQLAYGLAHANEYLNTFQTELNHETAQQLMVTFEVSVSSNYFFEIAKLRALRLLWKTLASEYQTNTECHIITTPTKRNKTIYDFNTNSIRTTTECMSAILGGANTICNLPYDIVFKKSNRFSERIAKNQLLILKHESHFNKVNNPVDGTYYIEVLTHQLAEKALVLFKDIEQHGGFLNQLKESTIQRKIKESATKEQLIFNAGEEVLIGLNKYPNPEENIKTEIELYPFVKTNPRKTLIEPIIEKRLAENLEQNRLKNE